MGIAAVSFGEFTPTLVSAGTHLMQTVCQFEEYEWQTGRVSWDLDTLCSEVYLPYLQPESIDQSDLLGGTNYGPCWFFCV